MKKFMILFLLCCFFVSNAQAAVSVTQDTVQDSESGFEWQLKDAGKMRWRDGVNYCKDLSLAGKNDWRLPSRKELEKAPKLAKHFVDLESVFYWTATDYEPDREKSWLINLLYGFVAYDNGGYSYNIKCVRDLN